MPIGVIFKTKQPDEYEKLQKIRYSKPKKVEVDKRDLEDLMGHSSYKRKGRAIRQVR